MAKKDEIDLSLYYYKLSNLPSSFERGENCWRRKTRIQIFQRLRSVVYSFGKPRRTSKIHGLAVILYWIYTRVVSSCFSIAVKLSELFTQAYRWQTFLKTAVKQIIGFVRCDVYVNLSYHAKLILPGRFRNTNSIHAYCCRGLAIHLLRF